MAYDYMLFFGLEFYLNLIAIHNNLHDSPLNALPNLSDSNLHDCVLKHPGFIDL